MGVLVSNLLLYTWKEYKPRYVIEKTKRNKCVHVYDHSKYCDTGTVDLIEYLTY